MSQAINQAVETFKRDMLRERLAQCSQAQRDLFNRLYSKGVPEDKLVSAIDLCDRTIKKNRECPARLTPPSEGDSHGNP